MMLTIVNKYLLVKINIFLTMILLTSCSHMQPAPRNIGDILLEELSHSNCSKACWQSVDPGVTRIEDFREKLDKSGINYMIRNTYEVARAATYAVTLKEDVPLIDEREGHFIYVVVDNGIIEQIRLPISICVSTIVEVYGIPERIWEEDGSYLLFYPLENLMFEAEKGVLGTNKSHEVFLVMEERFVEYYTSSGGEQLVIEWEQAKEVLMEECVDTEN